MRNLTNEEKVLRFLLNEYQLSKTTEVSIFRSDLETLEMKELDVLALFALYRLTKNL